MARGEVHQEMDPLSENHAGNGDHCLEKDRYESELTSNDKGWSKFRITRHLVTLSGTSPTVLLGQGDGTFGQPQIFPSVPNSNFVPPAIQLADMEPDGDLDLVMPNRSSPAVIIYLNQAR